MPNKFNYRPEIDGLRAIAVLSVMIFHIQANWLPSGFLGVDIFFVISGYLITGIMFHDMQTGAFSLVHFYKKRAKRILPIFLIVLMATLFVFHYFSIPQDTTQLFQSAVYSLFFSANLYFAQQSGYFDGASMDKPLQHIWSLSLEEQFYFVFPIILLTLYKLFHGKALPIQMSIFTLIILSLFTHFDLWGFKLEFIFSILLLLCYVIFRKKIYPFRFILFVFISLWIFSWIDSLDTSRYQSYFLPHIRAYELLIGSLYAFKTKPQSAPLNKVSWSILLLILFILFIPQHIWTQYTADQDNYIPRLILCSLVGWVLYSGSLKNILSADILVKIGLWSYSLYLWHWVILAGFRYVFVQNDLPLIAILLAAVMTFLFSYLSYEHIEKPARKASLSHHQFVYGMTAYFLGASCFAMITMHHKNLIDDVQNKRLFGWHQNICDSGLQSNTQCLQGNIQNKKILPTILAVGDSHNSQYNQFYHLVGKHENWVAYAESGQACSILLPEVYFVHHEAEGQNQEFCRQFRKRFADKLIHQYPTVILTQRWSQRLEEPDYEKNFNKLLQFILQNGNTIYVLRDNPNTGFENKNALQRIEFLKSKGITLAKPNQNLIIATEQANERIRKIVQKYPQIHWVDLDFPRYIPNNYLYNQMPMYYDDDHFNPYGIGIFSQKFIESGAKLIQ